VYVRVCICVCACVYVCVRVSVRACVWRDVCLHIISSFEKLVDFHGTFCEPCAVSGRINSCILTS
jgi:hypothetical protein